jgi:hypothetical protein
MYAVRYHLTLGFFPSETAARRAALKAGLNNATIARMS